MGIIVLVTVLGMGIAASIGMFSASSTELSIADEIQEVAGNESVTSTLEDSVGAAATASKLKDAAASTQSYPSASPHAELTESEIASDLKLQEIRDTYLRFTQALPGVSVFYAANGECGAQTACISVDDPNQILVRKAWAQEAPVEEVQLALAQAHTDIAVRRIWGSNTRAQRDLQDVIPACEVRQNYALLEAAEVPHKELDATDPSVQAMKDVVVSVMVDQEVPLTVYPSRLHTATQVDAANYIAKGQLPTIVMPVSSPKC